VPVGTDNLEKKFEKNMKKIWKNEQKITILYII